MSPYKQTASPLITDIARLDSARGKKQVWRPQVRTWGLSEANILYWRKYLWECWDFSAPGELCPFYPLVTPLPLIGLQLRPTWPWSFAASPINFMKRSTCNLSQNYAAVLNMGVTPLAPSVRMVVFLPHMSVLVFFHQSVCSLLVPCLWKFCCVVCGFENVK